MSENVYWDRISLKRMCDNGVPMPEGVIAMSENAVARTSEFIAE
jgi:hypothetical protein